MPPRQDGDDGRSRLRFEELKVRGSVCRGIGLVQSPPNTARLESPGAVEPLRPLAMPELEASVDWRKVAGLLMLTGDLL